MPDGCVEREREREREWESERVRKRELVLSKSVYTTLTYTPSSRHQNSPQIASQPRARKRERANLSNQKYSFGYVSRYTQFSWSRVFESGFSSSGRLWAASYCEINKPECFCKSLFYFFRTLKTFPTVNVRPRQLFIVRTLQRLIIILNLNT